MPKMQPMKMPLQMNVAKASAELKILRAFVDFINRQVGVYCDCLAGFQDNKVRIERQGRRNWCQAFVLTYSSRRFDCT
jgi:hypothetical protein